MSGEFSVPLFRPHVYPLAGSSDPAWAGVADYALAAAERGYSARLLTAATGVRYRDPVP
jgi:hypothetical protein